MSIRFQIPYLFLSRTKGFTLKVKITSPRTGMNTLPWPIRERTDGSAVSPTDHTIGIWEIKAQGLSARLGGQYSPQRGQNKMPAILYTIFMMTSSNGSMVEFL